MGLLRKVIAALELALQELDSEDSITNTTTMANTLDNLKENEKKDKNKDRKSNTEIETKPKISVAPLYENVFYQNPVNEAASFTLGLPSNVLEPPKEKPPPPPIEDSPEEDELFGNGNFKHTSSVRRIKKEIRNKRTSFLGIEGQVDDSYIDTDLTAVSRPDITSFLREETKIEKLLYKKTLSHDMDTNLMESRDSGFDVDRGPSAAAWYKEHSLLDTSTPHSTQNSEPYTHVTVTFDEEEAAKKQNEQTFNTNLSSKLSEATSELDKSQIETLDEKIQQQQDGRSRVTLQAKRPNEDWRDWHFDDAHTKEVLRFERELLILEQEELRRQRENLLRDQTRTKQKSVRDISTVPNKPEKPRLLSRPNKTSTPNYRHSMPNLSMSEYYTLATPATSESTLFDENIKRKPFVSEEHIQRHFEVKESRKVLYDERSKATEGRRQIVPNVVRAAQPALPPKPQSRESIGREITMRCSRIPSAVEYVNVERTPMQLRQKLTPVLNANANNGQYHHMTRQTLQEAEQRRIEEQRNKMRINQRHSYHQDMTPPPPLLYKIHTLSTSQQHIAQDFKRPVRNEVPRADPPKEEKLLSVSGRKKCSHCGEELGRGAAMIIESLSLCYHVWCFTCAVCGARLGDGRVGADVRVRGHRLHCHHCYSGDDGCKYSCV